MNLAIVQARMGSSRLPGKVMKKVCQKPILYHIINRLRHTKHVDRIVIATTKETVDDEIEAFCKEHSMLCYRGSTSDVLERFYQAAMAQKVKDEDVLIRITADCPLVDPQLIDHMLELYQTSGKDYYSNVNPPTFPDGLDMEVFDFRVLQQAYHEATLMSEREHVTLYIRNHPSRFTLGNFENAIDYSHYRWTVDEPEDLQLITTIYEALYPQNPIFFWKDVVKFLEEKPWLAQQNKKFKRNEGLLQSLRQDSNLTP